VITRIEPSPHAWAQVEEALARAGMSGIGARRAVFRDPWETLARCLRRLERFQELNGPEIIILNERELIPRVQGTLDLEREPAGWAQEWDRIPTEDGGAVLDLSGFGHDIAELASGAFPISVGRGDAIGDALDERTRARLQEFAQLDDFWWIHRQPSWETGYHASHVAADPEIWAPESIRGTRALELPASSSSPSCKAWRAVMPSVPVGDQGGPLFVRVDAGTGTDWWPVELAPEECVVSFVLLKTREFHPFLVGEES